VTSASDRYQIFAITCPFQAGADIARLVQGWRREPGQARLAVAMERNARAFNSRMALFGDRSAADVARAAGLGAVVDEAIADLDARPAALYEVRRIYRRRGDQRGPRGRGWVLGPDPSRKGTDVWRSLRTLATGTWDEMRARLLAERKSGGELEAGDGGQRLVFQRASAPHPSTERYLAVAVAGADKQRRALEELWEFVHREELPRQSARFRAGETPRHASRRLLPACSASAKKRRIAACRIERLRTAETPDRQSRAVPPFDSYERIMRCGSARARPASLPPHQDRRGGPRVLRSLAAWAERS
jgi:hypothetical protein